MTRVIGSIFAVIAVSDLLNMLYETAMDLSQKSSGVLEAKMEQAPADD